MMTGKVKFFNPLQGFGFIKVEDTDYFFHISQCPDNYTPQIGDELGFTPKKTDKGFGAETIRIIKRENE